MVNTLPKKIDDAARAARVNVDRLVTPRTMEAGHALVTGAIQAAESAIDKDGNVAGAAMREALETLRQIARAEKLPVVVTQSLESEGITRKVGRFEARKPEKGPSESTVANGRTVYTYGCRIMRTARDSWAIRWINPGEGRNRWLGETATIVEAIELAKLYSESK